MSDQAACPCQYKVCKKKLTPVCLVVKADTTWSVTFETIIRSIDRVSLEIPMAQTSLGLSL